MSQSQAWVFLVIGSYYLVRGFIMRVKRNSWTRPRRWGFRLRREEWAWSQMLLGTALLAGAIAQLAGAASWVKTLCAFAGLALIGRAAVLALRARRLRAPADQAAVPLSTTSEG